MTKEMTKTELTKAIGKKITRAKPIVRDDLIRSLKYKTKPTLRRYLKTARCLFAGTDHEDNDKSVPVGRSCSGHAETTGATVDNSREIC